MPFETIVIEPADTSRNRSHGVVAKEITAAFESIESKGGSFVTAIALADKSGYSGEGGHPDGAAYIVAKYTELKFAPVTEV